MVHRLRVLVAAVTCNQARAFTAPRPLVSTELVSVLLRSTPNDNGDSQFYDDFGESQFYDDFGGSFGSSTSVDDGAKFLGSLQTKILQTRELETANDAKLGRNWRKGNWSVKGFSLSANKSTSHEDSKAQNNVHVSAVAAPISTSLKDTIMPVDEGFEYRTIAVGRTDGSVFLVRIGEAYLTKFKSSASLVGDTKGEELSIRVENQWTEQDQIRPEEQEDLQPFEVLLNFKASELGEKCHLIRYHDIAEDDNEGYICTAAGDSGQIQLWILPSPGQQLESTTLSGGHQAKIVSLNTAVLQSDNGEEQHILISVSADGVVSMWNLSKHGQLLVSCQCLSGRSSDALITCADISNPSLESNFAFDGAKQRKSTDMLFLGLSDGYVMAYGIHNILSNGKCSEPDIFFRAHGTDSGRAESISAIKCGGDGTIENRRNAADKSEISSSVLLTGGEDGSVKQWEIMTQHTSRGIRMQHWPRLSTQRMKTRAHIFSPNHEGKVTSLAQQSQYDSSTFLSCGEDGAVSVWDAESGKMLYSMDGFSSTISSLACLGRDLLVTDGMDELVCVHDFSVEEDAASNGYELDW